MNPLQIPEVLPAFVLDASALLAQLHREPGADVVEALGARSAISSVNWSEVLQKVIARGSRQPREVWQGWESPGLRIPSADRSWAGLDLGVKVRLIR